MKKDEKKKLEEDTTKKTTVRRVGIVFFAVMLLLTFFSNTIMNYSLPQVAIVKITEGNVAKKVRGSGIVESAQEYEIKLTSPRKIEAVHITEGDAVSMNQILFTLDDADNVELEMAKEELEKMEIEYMKALLGKTPDYTLDNLEIEEAREQLEKAMMEQSEAGSHAQSLTTAENEESDYSLQVDKAQSKVDELQKELDGMGTLQDINVQKEYVKTLENELNALKIELKDLEEDLEDTKGNGDKSSITQLTRNIRDKKAVISEKEKDIAKEKEKTKTISSDNKKRKSLAKKLAAAEETLSSAQRKQTDAQKDVNKLAGSITEEEAADIVKERQSELDKMSIRFEEQMEADYLTQKILELDMDMQKKAIEKQINIVEALEANNQGRDITAGMEGMISELYCKAGDMVEADEIMAVINAVEEGYTAHVVVTKEQSELVKIGDEANVLNKWGSEIEAVVRNIKYDVENPGKNRIITFDVKGDDICIGESIAFSVGSNSEYYDMVVPNHAIREDNEGCFLLAVNIKSSPLGNRYSVSRHFVEVLAKDDNQSAILSDISEGQYIVTESTEALKEGDKVRLAN